MRTVAVSAPMRGLLLLRIGSFGLETGDELAASTATTAKSANESAIGIAIWCKAMRKMLVAYSFFRTFENRIAV